jgi:hypothetical protein
VNPTTDEIRDEIPEPEPPREHPAKAYNDFLAGKADELAAQREAETSENVRKDRDELEELYARQRRRREAMAFKHKLLKANMLESARTEWAERRLALQPTPEEIGQARAKAIAARRLAVAPAKIKVKNNLTADTSEGMRDELEARIAASLIHIGNKDVKNSITRMRESIRELGFEPRMDSKPVPVNTELDEASMDRLLNSSPPVEREAAGDD